MLRTHRGPALLDSSAALFVDAYRRYCWPVNSLADIKLAPFHILATERSVHIDKDHRWHMQTISRLCVPDGLPPLGKGRAGVGQNSSLEEGQGGLLMATPHKIISVADEAGIAEGIAWWEELTARGGEGMVLKPLEFVAKGPRGLIQPAVKCRGREYLRIIYGPKRSLALREFALRHRRPRTLRPPRATTTRP
jgi:protein phosphatase